jgi:hypothetical protein
MLHKKIRAKCRWRWRQQGFFEFWHGFRHLPFANCAPEPPRPVQMKLSATAAAALLAATSAAPSAPSRTTSWRVRLAGPGCDHEDLGAIFDEDAWPVHNSTFTFDAYTDHVNLDHALSKLRPGCAVVEQEQGRPGRDFLVPDGCESGRQWR